MSLLGIDVGTAGCNLTAVSAAGRILSRAAREYRTATRAGASCELDARALWGALGDALRQVAAETATDPIHALSVSCEGEAVTPLSSAARPLDLCILGRDAHEAGYVDRVESALGRDRLFDITGRVPGPSPSLSRMCWWRDNHPDLFQETWRFVMLGGLISHLLGASSTCDYSLAAGTMLFDTRQRTWSREVLEACDLPLSKLPDLGPAGRPVGVVAPRVAQEMGLRPNVRIILGGLNLCCNALGAGVIRSGMAALDLGDALTLAPAFEALLLSSLLLQHGLSMQHHVVPDMFLSGVRQEVGGSALRWFAETLAPLERREALARGSSVYNLLLGEMPTEPTPVMLLPPGADGAAGVVLGLQPDTTRGELVRALLEGITYPLAEGQQALEKAGIPVHLYRATGGGARSADWLQLAADLLGLPVERTRAVHPAAIGAAMIAGVGYGDWGGYQEAVQAVVQVAQRCEPEARRHSRYVEGLERFRRARAALVGV